MDAVTMQAAVAQAARISERPGGYSSRATGTRRAAYTFGSPGSNSTGTTYANVLQRVPFKLGVTTKRWRLHLRNYDIKAIAAITGSVGLTGIYLGQHALSATYAWTGNFTAAPTQIVGAMSTPSDGSEYVTDWITASGSQITAGVEMLLSVGFTASGQAVAKSGSSCLYVSGGSANVGDTAMPGGSSTPNVIPFGGIWIEYEFVGSNPVTLVLGDSLTEPKDDTAGGKGLRGWAQQYEVMHSAPMIVNAISGVLASNWTGGVDEKWLRFRPADGYTIDAAVILLGTNDLLASATGSAIAGSVRSITTNLRAQGIKRVYYGAVPPGGTITAGKETERVTLNTTLRALPNEALSCVDFDLALQDPTTFTPTLYSQWAQTDTLHPAMAAGHGRMARAVPYPL